MSTRDFLKYHGGYTDEQVDNLHELFPPLLGLDVTKHLVPKMRFLKETLLELENPYDDVLPKSIRDSLPPQYYGSRLERIVAPRHAFLVHMNLPHGKQLLLQQQQQQQQDEEEETTPVNIIDIFKQQRQH